MHRDKTSRYLGERMIRFARLNRPQLRKNDSDSLQNTDITFTGPRRHIMPSELIAKPPFQSTNEISSQISVPVDIVAAEISWAVAVETRLAASAWTARTLGTQWLAA